MKSELQSSSIPPIKPSTETSLPLVSYYSTSGPTIVYQQSVAPQAQLSQSWTVFSTHEASLTQKMVMCHKTTQCPDKTCPRGRLCTYYHSYADRRRPPFFNGQLTYVQATCPYITQGLLCTKGDQCQYSHNNDESMYHPAKYKTSMCLQGPMCLGDLCPWAHFPEDLRSVTLTQYYQNESNQSSQFQPFISYTIPASSAVPVQFTTPTYAQAVPALDAELTTFKTQPCTYQVQHNHKHCTFYHSTKDRRRPPGNYSAERCEASEDDSCPLGDNCLKSHSMVERLYHPDKYKTKYCNNYPERLGECEYGSYCCFAHSDSELKVELIHYLEMDEDFYLFYFKTGWCPFNHEHNKAACVYAHNWQDFRRKPNLFRYTNQLCPNWQSETFISEYKEGCIYEHNCGYCHGWKEQLYHPLTYKTMICPDIKKCQKGMECPYYHSEYDHRHPDKFHAYHPRSNRTLIQNPNLTITNNVNIQREYELRQMHASYSRPPQSIPNAPPAPLGIPPPHSSVPPPSFVSPASDVQRRYSEEIQHKPLLAHALSDTSTTTASSIKHKGSMDTGLSLIDNRSPPKQSQPLGHIREESPESPKDDDFFEIFKPSETDKTSASLFFTPSSTIKKTPDPKKSGSNEKFSLNLQGTEPKSCPNTPLPAAKTFVKSPVFAKLHLEESEANENLEKDRVAKFLVKLNLEKYALVFKGLTMNEIFMKSAEDLSLMGIKDEKEIKLIMEKARENLEKSISEGFESNGREEKQEREDTIDDIDELEKEGMKIFSYLEK